MCRCAHRQSGDGAGLFAADLAPDQIKAADALAALKPLLESAGLLKIGFNIKFDRGAARAARHHAAQPSTTRMLMSYALDAGRNAHGLDALAESMARPCHAIDLGELTGSGKGKLTFEQVNDRHAPPPMPPKTPTCCCGCGMC